MAPAPMAARAVSKPSAVKEERKRLDNFEDELDDLDDFLEGFGKKEEKKVAPKPKHVPLISPALAPE